MDCMRSTIALRFFGSLSARRSATSRSLSSLHRVLHLLLGDERVLVHELVFLRRRPAYGLSGVAGLLEQPPGLVSVVLVVERRRYRRVPGLLREEDARIQADEVLVPEARGHDRLHGEPGLQRL